MDYEQKYKEALERAKEWMAGKYGHYVSDTPQEIAEFIFPELKESEDERIRKELTDYIKSKFENSCSPTPSKNILGNWIAWLEKQGEHHIVCSEEQMKVLDEVLNFAANHESPYWNYYIFGTLNNLIRQFKN